MFEQSKLKIERANHHICDLNDRIIEYFKKSCPYNLFIDKSPSTGAKVLALSFIKNSPDEWSLIIGDCLNNLRSSLDILATDITQNENINFSFHETRERLESELTNNGLPPSAVTIILNVVKPYKAGNYVLWAMNKLNNINKHRLITPVVNFATVTNIGIQNQQTGEITRHIAGIGATAGVTLYLPLGLGNFKLVDNGQSSFEVIFQGNGYFDGEGIIETLHKMSEATSKAVEALES